MDGVCWSWSVISLQRSCDRIDTFSSSRITLLWEFCRQNVASWACPRSKASIIDSMGGTCVVCRLNCLVNRNYQQGLACDSFGLWRNHRWKDCLSCCTFLYLSLMSGAVSLSEGLLSTKEDDILKQSQAIWSIRWLSSSSCPDSWPLTKETAISRRVTWKRDCSHFQDFTEFARQVALRAAWSIPKRILQLDWGVLKMAPMANGSHVNFNWNLSLRKSKHWRRGVFSVPVYNLLEHFWVHFKCENFILHLTQHFW